MFLILTSKHEEQVKTIDKFLSALDPEYVTKMWEQLRIMGVLRRGSAGDPGENCYPSEVFSQLVYHAQAQDMNVQSLEEKIAALENDMRTAVKMIASLIPQEGKDPRLLAGTEYAFFSKYGQYP